MMTRIRIQGFVALVALMGVTGCCLFCKCPEPEPPEVGPAPPVVLQHGPGEVFSGAITSDGGEPIDGAEVEVNGEKVQTDAAGRFRIPVADAGRYVLNIRKPGYGLVSKIYRGGMAQGRYSLPPATTVSVDPTQPIVVQDNRASFPCLGRPSGRIDWSKYPDQRVPYTWDGSNWIPGDWPDDLRLAMQVLEPGTDCSAGNTIQIPANSLVGPGGNAPTGNVDVTISSIDLFAPDAMPGDLTVMNKREMAYMRSVGAGMVQVTADGKEYQLKDETQATIIMPVDPTQLGLQRDLPEAIPLLLYDEGRGVWQNAGTAKLNETRDAYVGKLGHFSTYNMDLVKTGPACLTVDVTSFITYVASLGLTTIDLEVTVPMDSGMAPVVKTRTINAISGDSVHDLINLPPDTNIALVPIVGDDIPYGTFVVKTGGSSTPPSCTSTVVLEVIAPPFSVPTLEYTDISGGDPILEVSYEWGSPLTSGNDFELWRSSASPVSGFTDHVDFGVVGGDDMPTYEFPPDPLVTPGVYWYRARAMDDSSYSRWSNVEQADTAGGPRKLLIVNSIEPASAEPTNIVQVRVSDDDNKVYNYDPVADVERLNHKDGDCRDGDDGHRIPSDDTTIETDTPFFEMDLTDLTPHYYVFIGLGRWVEGPTGEAGCGAGKWGKRMNEFQDFENPPSSGNYKWVGLEVLGHTQNTLLLIVDEHGVGDTANFDLVVKTRTGLPSSAMGGADVSYTIQFGTTPDNPIAGTPPP